ncbi:hypothetical protein Salat_1091500 [Sesamum alatum]|uniref:Uncharacterized protein n=1 Tax=Sesamum alatum TaxID=300844 RepID=A0AAE2CSW2_9LAMI|nr:hypothetical protein Salat_1091500 [Sesamum alatum]
MMMFQTDFVMFCDGYQTNGNELHRYLEAQLEEQVNTDRDVNAETKNSNESDGFEESEYDMNTDKDSGGSEDNREGGPEEAEEPEQINGKDNSSDQGTEFKEDEMELVVMVPTPQLPNPTPSLVSPGSILFPRAPPTVTQSSLVQGGSVPVLVKGGKKYVTMSNLSAEVAAVGTSHSKKSGSKKQPWIP